MATNITSATETSPSQPTESPKMTTTIQELQKNKTLWYKLHVFIYDLRNFREMPTSHNRLDSIIDASYIGFPYFTEEEVQIIKSTIVQGEHTLEKVIQETLEERLERREKKNKERKCWRGCAAHDLAPVFEKMYNIDYKQLAKDGEFLSLMKRLGFQLPEGNTWEGLGKKKVVVRSAQEKKKRGRR
jgi:hypothetical protein